MKLVMLADSFLLDQSTGINGTQVQMYNLATAFIKKGVKVYYLSRTAGQRPAKETIDGIEIHWLGINKDIFSWLGDLRKYHRLLNELQPDIVYQRGRSHLTWVAANWSKKKCRKFVWGSNGEDACDFWKVTGKLVRSPRPLWRKGILFPIAFVQDKLIHKGIKNASIVVNQTEYQKQRLQKNYGKNGIILPSYFLPPDTEKGFKKEKMVLWLANMSRGKQPEHFLELADACKDMVDWTFLLGGGTSDKSYYKQINNRIAQLPNCHSAGTIAFSETPDLYRKAALFVNTSKKEADGVPNAFIQATLSGTPVLTLNHDPNDWIATHGLGYCAHGNMEVFLKKGKSMLEDEKKLRRSGERCVRFARETFADDSTIATYLALFDSIKNDSKSFIKLC